MSQKSTETETTSIIEWCDCDEFPAKMCNIWPGCIDINGKIWGAEESFQKFRKRNVLNKKEE